MLVSMVVTLLAENSAPIARTHGHQAHALFLAVMRAADAALAERLHGPGPQKPFTVSPLRPLQPGGRTAGGTVPGGRYWLRITALTDEVGQTLLAHFVRGAGDPVRLGNAVFHIAEVSAVAGENPWAGNASFESLLAAGRTDPWCALEFASPTAFAAGGAQRKRVELLPSPELVFGGLLRRWNTFAPPDCGLPDDFLNWVREDVVVRDYQLETAMLRYAHGPQVGFTGRCAFEALGRGPTESLRLLNTLSDFALYAGVGYKTTMGMGQAKAVPVHRASQLAD